MNDVERPRVALVTGATRGIGRAIMLRLAADGYLVAGTATTDAGAQSISDTLKQADLNGSGYTLKVDDAASVAALIEALDNGPGLPLVLVNNAGVTRDNLLLRMKEDEWQTVFDTNVGGLYRLCKPLLRPMMKARWGRIINLSSVVSRMGNPGQSNYVASKSAIEGFTRALAQEVGSRSITVNAVAPGFIETDMTDALTDDQKTAMLDRIPLRRMGRVDDVAAIVSFLASDQAAYITGETLQVNGGLYMN
jgi:3-oxoacyl-[acyl-carrier protein] reductase